VSKNRNVTVEFHEENISFRIEGELYPGAPARGPSYSSGGEPADPPEFYVSQIYVQPYGYEGWLIANTEKWHSARFDELVEKALENALERSE
jgi:hypothetical protein